MVSTVWTEKGCAGRSGSWAWREVRDPEEREPAARNIPATTSKCDFISTPWLLSSCENSPHPVRVCGTCWKQRGCQKLHLAVSPETSLMFLQVGCLGQSFSCLMGSLRFPSLDTVWNFTSTWNIWDYLFPQATPKEHVIKLLCCANTCLNNGISPEWGSICSYAHEPYVMFLLNAVIIPLGKFSIGLLVCFLCST